MARSRIMLVEDEPGDALLLRRTVQKCRQGCVFTCVKTGNQAIDYLCGIGSWSGPAKPQPPHLIFLDLSLPGISGFDLLAWLQAHPALRPVPVVVVTASTQVQDHFTAMQLGARGCMRKPVNEAELADFLEKLLPPERHVSTALERPARGSQPRPATAAA